MKLTMCTYSDARQAGMCREGIINFLARYFGYSVKDLIKQLEFVTIRADKLLRNAPDNYNASIKKVINMAIMREGQVSI